MLNISLSIVTDSMQHCQVVDVCLGLAFLGRIRSKYGTHDVSRHQRINFKLAWSIKDIENDVTVPSQFTTSIIFRSRKFFYIWKLIIVKTILFYIKTVSTIDHFSSTDCCRTLLSPKKLQWFFFLQKKRGQKLAFLILYWNWVSRPSISTPTTWSYLWGTV